MTLWVPPYLGSFAQAAFLGSASSRILSKLQKRANMPLNIQLNQQSVKKLLLYSNPYNTLSNTHAFASIPCESAFKGSLSLQVTFHPFNLMNSPAHGFLCSLLDYRDTNLQFCPHCGVPLGHGREGEDTFLVNNMPRNPRR